VISDTEENLRFNQYFKSYNGQLIIKVVDTTYVSIENTAQQVMLWIGDISK
jgi:hypothetical protein